MQLERVGTQHQAGSDSYLTGAAFFKMKQVCQICWAEAADQNSCIIIFRSSLTTTLMRRNTVAICLALATPTQSPMEMGTCPMTLLNDHLIPPPPQHQFSQSTPPHPTSPHPSRTAYPMPALTNAMAHLVYFYLFCISISTFCIYVLKKLIIQIVLPCQQSLLFSF